MVHLAIVTLIALFIAGCSNEFVDESSNLSEGLETQGNYIGPDYRWASVPSRYFEFTKASSLDSFFERYTDAQVIDRYVGKVRYDPSACPNNLGFKSDKGILITAYDNGSYNCGSGIRSVHPLQFGRIVIVARVPLKAEAHSSCWLNLGNVFDGNGYREIDLFEHFNGKDNLISSGTHQGPNIDAVKANREKYSSNGWTYIDPSKFHMFELRWTPRRIRVFVANEDGTNRREVYFDKSKITRSDTYLVNRLQQPMKLRCDIAPNDSTLSRSRILRIKSISIYDCLQQETGKPTTTCKPKL